MWVRNSSTSLNFSNGLQYAICITYLDHPMKLCIYFVSFCHISDDSIEQGGPVTIRKLSNAHMRLRDQSRWEKRTEEGTQGSPRRCRSFDEHTHEVEERGTEPRTYLASGMKLWGPWPLVLRKSRSWWQRDVSLSNRGRGLVDPRDHFLADTNSRGFRPWVRQKEFLNWDSAQKHFP